MHHHLDGDVRILVDIVLALGRDKPVFNDTILCDHTPKTQHIPNNGTA